MRPGRCALHLARRSVPELAICEALGAGRSLLDGLGRAWTLGVEPRWSELDADGARRCSLPGYPFERARYWIGAPSSIPTPGATRSSPVRECEPRWAR